jgi:hypothetical protein
MEASVNNSRPVYDDDGASNHSRDGEHYEPPNEPPKDDPHHGIDKDKARRTVLYLMHFLHLAVALLLFIIVVWDLFTIARSLFMIYLIPFVIVIIIVEIFYLFKRDPPVALRHSVLAPIGLQKRSFIYQLAGAFAYNWTRIIQRWDLRNRSTIHQVRDLSYIVWTIGIALFVLAMLAKEYNFLDWVEEKQPDDDEADTQDNSHTNGDANANERIGSAGLVDDSRGKRISRYCLHILHFFIAVFLLTFIILNMISDFHTVFSLYLLPFIIHSFLVEICYLFHHRPPHILSQSIFAQSTFRRRAFAYQLAGAYALGCSGAYAWYWRGTLVQVAGGFATAVWLIGIGLFALAIAGKEYGFMDWLEEPAHYGRIRLDDEESIRDEFRRPPSIRSEASV